MILEAREFYDREDPARPGTLVDMDLLYPEGFCEALSGGEREHTRERILKRMARMGLTLGDSELYLEFAARGLPPSAGFGIRDRDPTTHPLSLRPQAHRGRGALP